MTSTPPFAPRTRTTQEPEPDLTSIVVTHRAIRHDLRRLAAHLAEISDRGAPSSQAHAIRRYAAALFAEICQHLDNEDGILWPVIAATGTPRVWWRLDSPQMLWSGWLLSSTVPSPDRTAG